MSSDESVRLDKLVASFQGIKPDNEQILKWHMAIEEKRRKRRSFLQVSMGLAAGVVIGLLCANLVMRTNQNQEIYEEYSATLAMVSTKNLN